MQSLCPRSTRTITPRTTISRTAQLLAIAILVVAAACDDAHAPHAPLAPQVEATASAAYGSSAGAPSISAVVLDDAIERLVPALGDEPGVAGVRTALVAVRATLPAVSGPWSGADATRVAATLVAVRAALTRLASSETLAPERDALTLALDAVQVQASANAR